MRTMKRRHSPYMKFKDFLSRNKVKQLEVANLLGKSKSALNQNINGTGGDFSLEDIRKICSRYHISSDMYFVCPEVSNEKLTQDEHASSMP